MEKEPGPYISKIEAIFCITVQLKTSGATKLKLMLRRAAIFENKILVRG